MADRDFDAFVDDALGLFASEEAELTPPPTPPGIWGALDAKWTAYKGAHRACDGCTELIHHLGAGRAPHPRPTYWRRKGPNGDRFLCNEHGQEHKRLDDRVTAEHKAAAAVREHNAKAARTR